MQSLEPWKMRDFHFEASKVKLFVIQDAFHGKTAGDGFLPVSFDTQDVWVYARQSKSETWNNSSNFWIKSSQPIVRNGMEERSLPNVHHRASFLLSCHFPAEPPTGFSDHSFGARWRCIRSCMFFGMGMKGWCGWYGFASPRGKPQFVQQQAAMNWRLPTVKWDLRNGVFTVLPVLLIRYSWQFQNHSSQVYLKI